MENNKKIKFPLWVTPKTMETVKEMYKDDDCRSQSEFTEKAIRAYVGYLRADNSPGMLPNYMVSTMKAIVDSSDTRMCRMLFKLAVAQNMQAHIVADIAQLEESQTENYRLLALREMRETNGRMAMEDILNNYQRD